MLPLRLQLVKSLLLGGMGLEAGQAAAGSPAGLAAPSNASAGTQAAASDLSPTASAFVVTEERGSATATLPRPRYPATLPLPKKEQRSPASQPRPQDRPVPRCAAEGSSHWLAAPACGVCLAPGLGLVSYQSAHGQLGGLLAALQDPGLQGSLNFIKTKHPSSRPVAPLQDGQAGGRLQHRAGAHHHSARPCRARRARQPGRPSQAPGAPTPAPLGPLARLPGLQMQPCCPQQHLHCRTYASACTQSVRFASTHAPYSGLWPCLPQGLAPGAWDPEAAALGRLKREQELVERNGYLTNCWYAVGEAPR